MSKGKTKGVREAAVKVFAELMPLLKTEPALLERRGMKFRSLVHDKLQEVFGITRPAAGAAYQHAFAEAKKLFPEELAGIGRLPEKNNGGRKKKDWGKVITETVTGSNEDENATVNADATPPDEEVKSGIAALEAELEAQGKVETPPEAPKEKLFNVTTKDGKVVAERVSFWTSQELIEKAKKAKKAKLVMVEVQ